MSISLTHKNPTGVTKLFSTSFGSPYFVQTMCNMFQDQNWVAKFHSIMRLNLRQGMQGVRWYSDEVIWLYCQYQHVETGSKQTH